MSLREYLSGKNISYRMAAADLGISYSRVGQLCRLVNPDTPPLPLAFRIERYTGGQVPASSWLKDAEKTGT